MRTFIRLQALGLLIATALGAWWLGSARATGAVAIRSNVEVHGATPEQLALARWAVGRFEVVGLEPPTVEIEIHADPAGCGGHLGFARLGRVDVCSVLVNAMTRRALLHEMSHIWLDQNAGAVVRGRFVDLRDLPSWNASSDPWALRGYEQGAEIMAWTLGERILTPQIPFEGSEELDVAFELLTVPRDPREPTTPMVVRTHDRDDSARKEVNGMGVPPAFPSPSTGGADIPLALSMAIGITAATVGWLAARLAGGRDRSAAVRPKPDVAAP